MQYGRNLPQWIDLLWLSLLSLYVMAGAGIVPFHGDESTLIYMGRDYYYQFVEDDLSKILFDELWTTRATEQQLRLLNGTISKYVYGWIASNAGYSLDDINDQWDWGADYFYNQNTGRIPSGTLLQQERLASAFQLSLAIIALFLVARLVFNRPIAYLASLYFALNPVVLLNSRRAMMEGSHLLGMMLLLLVATWISRQRQWWHYMLLGIVAGFAIATKHPNAIIAALIFIAYFSYDLVRALRAHPKYWRRLIKTTTGLTIAGLLTLLVFYILNPAWWEEPVSSAQQALSLRSNLLKVQSSTFDNYATFPDRVAGLMDFVFVARPQYYEVAQWSTYTDIEAQIETYERSILSGVPIGGSQIGGIGVLLLTLFGIVHFARNTAIAPEHRWLIIIWGIGIFILTFILTPLPWARYYMPIYPFIGLIIAYSVYTLAIVFRHRITQ